MPTDPAPSRPQQHRPHTEVAIDASTALTRAGALWTALIAGFLILILLLVFIVQNNEPTSFTFLGWHWRLPVGVALLLAAIAGGLLTVAVGTVRILQLRHTAKKLRAAVTGGTAKAP